jgi:hypothetical protein
MREKHAIVPIDMSCHGEYVGEARMLWRLQIMCHAVQGVGRYVAVDVDSKDHASCIRWLRQCADRMEWTGADNLRVMSTASRQWVVGFDVMCDFCEFCCDVVKVDLWKRSFDALRAEARGALQSRIQLASRYDPRITSEDDGASHRQAGFGVDEIFFTLLVTKKLRSFVHVEDVRSRRSRTEESQLQDLKRRFPGCF